MQASTDDNSIILVRSAPGSGAAARSIDHAADALRDCAGEMVVFFHGAGVDQAMPEHAGGWQALSGSCRLKLEVCSAAWQRRHEREPEVPFTSSSLVRFWHRVATGYRLAGPREDARSARTGGAWVIPVTAAPSEPESRELLELVLAGASLELPLVVIFRDRGRWHLVGEAARGWRQLLDFDLAELYHVGEDGFEPGIPSTPLDHGQAERLLKSGRGVICP